MEQPVSSIEALPVELCVKITSYHHDYLRAIYRLVCRAWRDNIIVVVTNRVKYTLKRCARKGYFDLVKLIQISKQGSAIVVGFTISHNNFGMLKYLHETGYSISESSMSRAAEVGNMKMANYIYIKKGRDVLTPSVTSAAAFGEHLDMLKWLHERLGCEINAEAAHSAAIAGNLEILTWLKRGGHKFGVEVMCQFAYDGRMDLLEWGIKESLPITDAVSINAAIGGRIEVLKFLHANDSYREMSCQIAAKALLAGWLDIYTWAIDNGYYTRDSVSEALVITRNYKAFRHASMRISDLSECRYKLTLRQVFRCKANNFDFTRAHLE